MKALKTIFSLFSQQDRRKAILLLLPVILSASFEVASIALIMPFIGLVADPKVVMKNQVVASVYHHFNFHSQHHFLVTVGFLVLASLLIGNIMASVSIWLSVKFASSQRTKLGKRLIQCYVNQPYEFFLNCHTSELAKQIISDVSIVVERVLICSLQMINRLISITFNLALITIVSPKLALCSMLVLGVLFAMLHFGTHRLLSRISQLLASQQNVIYRSVGELFGGIKLVKLYHNSDFFVESFTAASDRLANAMANNTILGYMPKYLFETVAFGGILSIILYLLSSTQASGSVIPILAVYAFAGYRILPGLQGLFSSYSNVRSGWHSLLVLVKTFNTLEMPTKVVAQQGPLAFEYSLCLNQLCYQYPGAKYQTLSKVDITIAKNMSVGIVGATGAGKTTLVDILLGLLLPEKGSMTVDGVAIDSSNLTLWQGLVGYVPQSIYLLDASIKENIAFGVSSADIDQAQIERVAKIAHIHDFVNQDLADGYDTKVGERGVRLSGGQQQRIGIARALYRNPELLVFDEATSALDNLTESSIMTAVSELKHQKTMVMIAHRLSTIQACDKIYYLDHGKVIASGSYKELLAHCEPFKKLAMQKVQEGVTA